MPEQTFQEDMNQKIEDLEHNKDVQAIEIRNLREKLAQTQIDVRKLQLEKDGDDDKDKKVLQ